MTCFLIFAFRLSDERHGGEPFHSRAAQELEQEGFHLVITMMGEHDVIAILAHVGLVARRASRSFGAVAAAHMDLDIVERDAALTAEAPAKRRPVRGVWTQLVIDVERGEPEAQLARNCLQAVEQNDRIDATRKTDDQTVARLDDVLQLRGD